MSSRAISPAATIASMLRIDPPEGGAGILPRVGALGNAFRTDDVMNARAARLRKAGARAEGRVGAYRVHIFSPCDPGGGHLSASRGHNMQIIDTANLVRGRQRLRNASLASAIC